MILNNQSQFILISILLVQSSSTAKLDITKCRFFSEPASYLPVASLAFDSYELSLKLYSLVLNECAGVDVNTLDEDTKSHNPNIFPGTKWCGQGDNAQNFDDLGTFSETDKCCREHDKCDDYMLPGESKHNLTNEGKTTRLTCTCDAKLRQCLQDVNSIDSNLIGFIFFTIVHNECYKYEHPIARCIERKLGFFRVYCTKYKLNEKNPKRWQWFEQNDWTSAKFL